MGIFQTVRRSPYESAERRNLDSQLLITRVSSLSGDSLDNESLKLVCPVCGKIVHGRNRRQNLDNHMLVHSGLRPHKCHLCSYSFTQLGNLRRHMKTVHKLQQDVDTFETSRDDSNFVDESNELDSKIFTQYIQE